MEDGVGPALASSRGRPLLVVAGLVGAFLALLAMEGVFRFLGWPKVWPSDLITEYDPTPLLTRTRRNLSIRTYPRGVQVTTNSAGFRGGEVSLEKPGGVFRVFALGDSTTFGYDVADDETYSAVLERLLNAGHTGKRYEVVNAGVIGYTTVQGLRQMKDVIFPYHPDVVIVSFGLNDACWLWKYIYYGGRELKDKKPAPAWRIRLRNALFNGSAVLRWAIWSVENRREARFRARGPAFNGAESVVPRGEYAENLGRFVRLAREAGAKVVFLPAPIQLKYPPIGAVGGMEGATRADAQERLRVGQAAMEGAHTDAGRRDVLRKMALAQEMMGERSRAIATLREALRYEDRRDDQRLNALRYSEDMLNAARLAGASVVDAPAIFAGLEVSGNPPGLFADPYHAGVAGHRIIAEELAKAIRKL